MTFDLNDLRVIYSEQLWLELSDREQEYTWQQIASQSYSNAAACWTAFLNCLCSNTFLTWLKEDPDLQDTPKVWPDSGELPSFWEVVNGTGLTLGETRLVLIPSEKSNLQEFQIPQEWVDIPNWAAHYYLALQLNLEERWLRVWGYASHEQIREQAKHDPIARTYSLERDDLIEDLNVMWITRELCPPRKLEVKSLPSLSPAQLEKLLEKLGKWTPYSPRLDVAFEQWAALMASDSCRQHLYELRLENQKGDFLGDSDSTLPIALSSDEQGKASSLEYAARAITAIKGSHSRTNNLSQWFQNIFEAGWQSLDTLFSPQHRALATQFRSDAVLNGVRVKGAKLIDLGMQLGGTTVVLLIGLTTEVDDRVSIRVQLYPGNGETYLPPNVRLVLLSQSETTLQDVTSRSYDHYIQLKRFKSPSGKRFSIQVILGNVTIKEDFVLEPLVGG